MPSLHLLACLLASPPALLEDDFVAGLQDIFEAKIMFKRVLGLKIAFPRPDGVAAHMARRVEPVGTTPTTASTAEPSMLRWTRWPRWARATWMRARCCDCSVSQSWARWICEFIAGVRALARRLCWLLTCCGWARGWPGRGWNSAALAASCCPLAQRLTPCRDGLPAVVRWADLVAQRFGMAPPLWLVRGLLHCRFAELPESFAATSAHLLREWF